MPKSDDKKTVAVIGAGGQLGQEMVRFLGVHAGTTHAVIALPRAQLELGDPDRIERVLTPLRPWAVINAAAFNNVDLAESRHQQALEANARGPATLARLAAREGWRLLHFSTDYVFGGDGLVRPRLESDAPAPVNFYGYSKLLGEEAVRREASGALVVRVAHLYGGKTPLGRASLADRFLDLARRGQPIRVTDGQRLTPTSVRVLAPAVMALLDAGESGLFHLAGGGECSAYEYAEAVVQIAGLKGEIEIVAGDSRPACRSRHTVLENARWNASGRVPLPPWRDALAEYLAAARGGAAARGSDAAGRVWGVPKGGYSRTYAPGGR